MNEWMSDQGGALAYRCLTRSMTEADSNKAIDEALINLEADLLAQEFKLTKTERRPSENGPREFWEVSGHGIKTLLIVQMLSDSQGPYLKVTYNINKA